MMNDNNRNHNDLYDVQWIDIKYLIDKESVYRGNVKKLLSDYREWRQAMKQKKDIFDISYSAIDGTILRHQLEKTIQAYWVMRRSRKKMYDYYMQQCERKNRYHSTNNKQSA